MDVESQEQALKIFELLAKYKDNFPAYASGVLKCTRTGEGYGLAPLEFNSQQQKLHALIEQQKRETGRVRVVILKSRRLGISTYVAGRFTHNLAFAKHRSANITTHKSDASQTVFKIYKRYLDNLPPFIKPPLKSNNTSKVEFEGTDCHIEIATANSAETGRGSTYHLMHLSEVAFWENGEEIVAGLLQTVSEAPGTEIIFESTAKGIGNTFHNMWCGADKIGPDGEITRGTNGYLGIFLNWLEDDKCYSEPPEDFEPTTEEKELIRIWGMNNGQLWWRRKQIAITGEAKFLEEYPLTAAEAFRVSNNDSFITSEAVLKARKSNLPINNRAPLVIGCDVARSGKDSTCLVWRRGRNIYKYIKYQGLRNDEVAYKLIDIIKTDKPAKINVDASGGFGTGVIDFLRDKGYETEEVHFSSKPYDDKYYNRRAEIYGELREWLNGEVSIPDDDDIETDLCSFGYSHKGEKIKLEAKDEVKKRIRRSPDVGDAIALTFATPLNNMMGGASHLDIWSQIKNREPDYNW